jgi:hypothetical protein
MFITGGAEVARFFALVMLGVAVAAGAFASNELAGGWEEIPQHWWSTFAVGVPIIAALFLYQIAIWRR